MNLTVHTLNWNGGTPSDQLISDNGIIIGASSNGSSTFSHTTVVPDNTSVTIQVFEPGFPIYSMLIDNVYNVDKTVYLMMSPDVLDTNDVDYKRPRPMFYYFQDPCSFKIDYYNASTQPGVPSWYLNNELLEEGNLKGSFELCNPELVQLKVRGQAFNTSAGACPVTTISWDRQWANTNAGHTLPGFTNGVGETGNTTVGVISPITTYLADDAIANIRETEYRPEIYIDISTPTDQTDTCCYTQDEEVTLSAAITYHEGSASDYTYTWKIEDPEGLSSTSTSTVLSLPLSKLGSYIVELILTHTKCNNVFKKQISVETCNYLTFDYVKCGTYRINNKSSFKEITYNIRSVDNLETHNGTLSFGKSINVNFKSPSIYIVKTIVKDEEEREYVLHNYCSIEECLGDYIEGFICGDSCGDCPNEIELNRFLLMYYTYFLELNREYSTNNFYNGLLDTDLIRLTEIKTVLDKIVDYCSKRKCKSFVNTSPKNKNCGCK